MTQAAVAGRALGAPWQAWPFGVRGARRLRHAPFSLFIVAILGYGAAFAWYMLEHFDLVDLVREVSLDDAFYYFQIAYYMTEGRFSTFDGGLTRTNGYHPLWMFLLTPFYWVFDKIEALFAIKAFEIMLMAAGVALAAAAARVARLPWILLFAALPALYVQAGMLWGMESALGLFALGLLLLAACLFARHPARWRWPLAIIVFALPWVRLEYVAIAVAASAMLGFLEWTGRFALAPAAAPSEPLRAPSAPSDRAPWRLNAALPLAGSGVGILAYFAYNSVVFGGSVPVSGTIKAIAAQKHWLREGGYDLAKSIEFAAQHDVFNDGLAIALEVCVYALVVWWFSRSSRSREDVLLLAFLAALSSLAAGHLAVFTHYVLFMNPNFFEWYYVPAYLTEALVVPLRCWVGIYVLRRLLGPRLPRLCDVLRWAAIVAAGGVLAAKADLAAPFRAVDEVRAASAFPGFPSVFVSRIDDRVRPFNTAAYMSAVVMDRLLPEDTVLGSWDSGIVGYFSRFTVMNLDGLANSYAYRKAIDDHDQRAFWRQHGVFVRGNGYLMGQSLRMSTFWEEVVFLGQAEPVLRRAAPFGLGFDLRVERDHLVYARAPCTRRDIAAPFFLHVFPASPDDLPEGADFENRDFWFDRVGDLLDGACRARVPLPDYDIDRIRTGQAVTEVDFLFKSAQGSRLRRGMQFRLYRDDPEWVSSVDRAAWFRERMTPHLELQADGTGLLLEGRAAQAFAWECTADAEDVAEWSFGGKVGAVTDWTQTADGLCAAAVVLPHGHLEPVRVRRAALDEAVAGWMEGRPPAIPADSPGAPGFDVHFKENALLYVKAACQQADIGMPFYLHLVPLDDELDEGRELAGYNNLDFMFYHHGDWFGEEGGEGPCLAEVPLPSYGIAEIRTGQYAPGDFRVLWEGTIHPRPSGQRETGAET